jgi:hypothetical protein
MALPFHDRGTRRRVRGQCHSPAALYPRERPGTHCTGSWVGPRAGLDRCGKSPPTGIRSPDRPARSHSLYRLSYPAHFWSVAGKIFVGKETIWNDLCIRDRNTCFIVFVSLVHAVAIVTGLPDGLFDFHNLPGAREFSDI